MAKRKLKHKGRNITDEQGRYKYELTFRCPGDKNPRRRHKYFFTDAEADEYIRQEQGKPLDMLTWQEAFAVYKRDHESRAPAYLRDMKSDIDKLAKDVSSSISEITLQAMAAWLVKQNGTGRTANRRLAHFLSVARYCRSRGLIKDIPWEHCAKLPHKPKERLPVPIADLDMYIDAVKALEARLPLLLIILTGERVSAILNILPEDTSLEKVNIIKKGGGKRSILLTEPMRAVIQDALKLRAQAKSPPKTLFFNTQERKWNRYSFRSHLLKAQERVGLDHATPHQFRHTMGSLAADLGYSRDMIQSVMGHDSPQSADSYIHENPDRAMEVHERVYGTFMAQNSKILANLSQQTPPQSNSVTADQPCPICGHKLYVNAEGKIQTVKVE